MKYKISEDSPFEVVTEDGEFVCSVVGEGVGVDNRKQLEATARRIVTALNSADWAAIHIKHTLENAQAAGLCN